MKYNIKVYEKHCPFELKIFIEKWHYSHTLPKGCNYIFGLYDNNTLIGAAAIGETVGTNCNVAYGIIGKIVELRRLCLINNTPKNTESWFIARIMQWLKNNTNVESVLSYADPRYGHKGTIYKASNFVYLGVQKSTSVGSLYKIGNKKFHLAAIYRDTLTGRFVQACMAAGIGKTVKLKPKHIYIYPLRRRKQMIEYFQYGWK